MTTIARHELPNLCEPLAGGYYMGLLMIDGSLHALICAPKYEGETRMAGGEFGETIEGADHYADGLANTRALAAADNTLGQWAMDLRIGGYDDWAVPARDQLELLYRNGKPTDEENLCSFRDGENPFSRPVNYPYTEESPQQANNPLFKADGEQAFAPEPYWSSTQYTAYGSWLQGFDDGFQSIYRKGGERRVRRRVRAVRTIPVIDSVL